MRSDINAKIIIFVIIEHMVFSCFPLQCKSTTFLHNPMEKWHEKHSLIVPCVAIKCRFNPAKTFRCCYVFLYLRMSFIQSETFIANRVEINDKRNENAHTSESHIQFHIVPSLFCARQSKHLFVPINDELSVRMFNTMNVWKETTI